MPHKKINLEKQKEGLKNVLYLVDKTDRRLHKYKRDDSMFSHIMLFTLSFVPGYILLMDVITKFHMAIIFALFILISFFIGGNYVNFRSKMIKKIKNYKESKTELESLLLRTIQLELKLGGKNDTIPRQLQKREK